MKIKNIIYVLVVLISLSGIAFAEPTQHKPRIEHGTGYSTNWAGYAVTQNNVTDVKGSWIVPTVICQKGKSTYSASWVGIDGYNSNTVEQLGTDSDCSNGKPTYYGWYEFYPNPAYYAFSSSVKAGDVISAEVIYNGNDSFTLSMTDSRTTETFTKTGIIPNTQRTSAEWIIEAPWMGKVLPLADFGMEQFGNDYTHIINTGSATINGITGNIGSFGDSNIQKIIMVTNAGLPKTNSVSFTNGTSFLVQWLRS